MVALTGCLKDSPPNDFSTVKPIVELPYSGFEYFGSDVLSLSTTPQDVSFTVNVASVYPLTTDLAYTVKVNDAALAAYNASLSTSAPHYTRFPDSTYSFTKKAGVIKAGKRLDTIHITFFSNKVDPVQNYMLPISLADASGQTISGNFSTHYFHVVGNPLGGSYTWDFTRFNGDTTVAQNGSSFTGKTTSPSPTGPTTILFPDSYLRTFVDANAGVLLSFDNNNGILSNFAVAFDANTIAGLAAGGFTVSIPPKLLTATIVGNASTNYKGSIFRFYFSLINSSGGTRTLIDKFVKL